MSPADPVDDYVPGHGDLSYDVCHYDLALQYRVETSALSAKATLSAVALTATDRVVLDLVGLRVSKVLLDGTLVRFTHRAGRLVVKTGTRLGAGRSSGSRWRTRARRVLFTASMARLDGRS